MSMWGCSVNTTMGPLYLKWSLNTSTPAMVSRFLLVQPWKSAQIFNSTSWNSLEENNTRVAMYCIRSHTSYIYIHIEQFIWYIWYRLILNHCGLWMFNCISEWVQWLPPWFFPLGFPIIKQTRSQRPGHLLDETLKLNEALQPFEGSRISSVSATIPDRHPPPSSLAAVWERGAPFVPVPSAITISRCGLRGKNSLPGDFQTPKPFGVEEWAVHPGKYV